MSRKLIVGVLTIVALMTTMISGAYFPQIVATDSLRRTIASPEDVGPIVANRQVGVFYYVAYESNHPTYDEIIAGGLDPRLNVYNPAWNWVKSRGYAWGNPAMGQYPRGERLAIRKNLQMLTLAGVNFIVMDYTNDEIDVADCNDAVDILIEEVKKLQGENWNPPKIAFMTNTNSRDVARKIYDTFYANEMQSSVWFRIGSVAPQKPLLIAHTQPAKVGTQDKRYPVEALISQLFAVKETMWPAETGLTNTWPWISWERPQTLHVGTGSTPEKVMSVSPAQHSETGHMTSYPLDGLDKNWGRGYGYGKKDHSADAIAHGVNISEQWSMARAQEELDYTFVSDWNGRATGLEVKEHDVGNWSTNGTTWIDVHEDGSIGADIITDDPQFFYSGHPFGAVQVSQSANYIVKFNITIVAGNGTGQASAELFPNGTNPFVSANVLPNISTQTLEFDLRNHSAWNGMLKSLRFDPTNFGIGGSVKINWYSLEDNNGNELFRESFPEVVVNDQHDFGWDTYNVSSFVRGSKGTVYGVSSNNDPILQSKSGLGVNIDKNKFVRIRMRNMTNDTWARLYFSTTTNVGMDESKAISFPIVPQSDFQNYTIDLSGNQYWTGTLDQLRLDPNSTSNGRFALDYIRISGSDPEAFPAKHWEFTPERYSWDACNKEYSRDIEPSSTDLQDNYYLQLVDNVRKQSGVQQRVYASVPVTITSGSQWSTVFPAYKDFMSDVDLQKYPKAYDIIDARVARDAQNLQFLVRVSSRSNINFNDPANPKSPLVLYLDVDGNHENGWFGYDYVVNRTSIGSFEKSLGGWNWLAGTQLSGTTISGKELSLKIPLSRVGGLREPFSIQFKWVSAIPENNIMAFYSQGDAAPDGRFNFEYVTSSEALQMPRGTEANITSRSASSEYFPATNATGGTNFWSSYPLTSEQEAWFQVNFPRRVIGEIEITPRTVGRIGTAFPRDFHFEYIENGVWRRIPDLTFYEYPAPAGNSQVRFRLTQPVSTSAIRWVGTKHRYGNDGIQFFMQARNVRIFSPATQQWDFTNTVEGWVPGGTTSSLTSTSGSLSGTLTGNDPQVLSPDNLGLAISKKSNSIIRVKMRNLSASTNARLYFLPNGAAWGENYAKNFDVIPNDAISREYVVELDGLDTWNGILKRLRIDPSDMAGVSSGSFLIDYIRICDRRDPAYSLDISGNAGDWGGWSVANPVMSSTINQEGYATVVLNGSTPLLKSSDPLGLDINKSKIIRIRQRNQTSAVEGMITFTTIAGATASKSYAIVANDRGFREYVIDMTGVAAWSGVLKQLRVSPAKNTKQGSFDVDYIRIQNW